jgi:hypothetical protein
MSRTVLPRAAAALAPALSRLLLALAPPAPPRAAAGDDSAGAGLPVPSEAPRLALAAPAAALPSRRPRVGETDVTAGEAAGGAAALLADRGRRRRPDGSATTPAVCAASPAAAGAFVAATLASADASPPALLPDPPATGFWGSGGSGLPANIEMASGGGAMPSAADAPTAMRATMAYAAPRSACQSFASSMVRSPEGRMRCSSSGGPALTGTSGSSCPSAPTPRRLHDGV